MKNTILTIVAIVAMAMTWPSCTQIEEEGTVQFGLELSDDTGLKAASADASISAALITIVSENGEVIFDKEYLPIYRFGSEYTTRSLKIPVGRYQLAGFMLIDSSGMVLWATPREGSSLAHLVRNPLPIQFGISAEESTTLDIQVIRVQDHPPADFGYLNFDIDFVDRFCLKVFYSSRCMEEWNDSILGPNGDMAPIHEPRLSIWAGDRMILDEPLNQGLNHYVIPMVAKWYALVATDCHGKVIYREQISVLELLDHRCLDNFEPLVIYRDNPEIIITPEGLLEPTIRQGVFGSLTYPVDDTLPTDRYDVWPVVRDVYFYPFSVLDSIYTFAPMDCYFPLELIRMDPVAIVRSNSDGFFQVPLRVGEYLYLVKEDDHFYIDTREAHLSSRRPGYVMVYPEEVTMLFIQMLDCSMWQ